ncbi:MAG: DEAD/DEAH box helicase family protein [Nitrosopumilus sp.]|nr:DEAD/DEAH box helicase family protein [Nitrosopumilus sp.]
MVRAGRGRTKHRTFYDVLDEIRRNNRTTAALGAEFERLTKMFLQNDSIYADLFKEVYLWKEWKGNDGQDTGIDLVAEGRDGSMWGIQCKFYDEDSMLDQKTISTFIAKTGQFEMKRMLVFTGGAFTTNAMKVIQGNDVRLVYADEMAAAAIDWDGYPDNLKRRKPKELRPHQVEAVKNVQAGFEESDRGRMVMACGTGKTLTALHIAESQAGKGGMVLYAVPSISLVMQSMREWSDNANIPHRYLLVCSDPTTKDDSSTVELPIPPTTNPILLGTELRKKPDRMTVVFSTYHSLGVVKKAMRGRPFDIIFADEAHRTTGTSSKIATDDPDEKLYDDTTYYTMIHRNSEINGRRRLYMTATERLYSEALKKSAERAVISMDDEEIYGRRFHQLTFKEAVERELLSDFRVKIAMLPEEYIRKDVQQEMARYSEIEMDEPAKLSAVWHAVLHPDDNKKTDILQRVIVFSNRIAKSKEFAGQTDTDGGTFQAVVDMYNRDKKTGYTAETRHIDGKSKALERRRHIRWLSDSHEAPDTCRMLSNARCLSEGVDVPALDGVVFIEPRKSKIDVVQSVGRVMRRSDGKKYGYVILPVALPAGKPYHESLNDGKTFKVAWEVLRALRSHDESFAVEINKLILEQAKDPEGLTGRISVVTPDKVSEEMSEEMVTAFFGKLRSALVREVGDVNYYDAYGEQIGAAAAKIEARIQKGIKSNKRTKEAISGFNKSLKRVVSDAITEKDTVQVVSQHMVLSRVFDGLFKGKFRSENPVAKEFEKVVRRLNMPDITADLEDFYKEVDDEMEQITSREGRQSFIKKIYGNFFASADKKGAEKHGVVYTPIECIDFIINSVEYLLHKHFGKGFNTKGVSVLEPFAGTGTFITRLLESGLVKDLEDKYLNGISANELILLAHYVSTINIETTYESLVGGKYLPFRGMTYTDTLDMNPRHIERPDLSRRQQKVDRDLPELDGRIKGQMKRKIDVIIGNPPYSASQKSFDDENPNISYPDLDKRIEDTYGQGVKGKAKGKLRDSYIRSIRWMSDRISDCGIIGIITNGSFMREYSSSGMRASLVEEFDEIWCLDLRGNQRTKGEESKKEGGKIFGSGSRAPVAITLFVKKSQKGKKKPAKIYYKNIGDYLTAKEKIEIISEWESIDKIEDWTEIIPDKHNDWLDKRNDEFYEYHPIGSKDVKSGKTDHAIFKEYSPGIVTARDVWAYSSSKKELEKNMKTHITYFNNMNPKKIIYDKTKGKWDPELTAKRIKNGKQKYDPKKIRVASYRPFFKQYLYFDVIFNIRRSRMPQFFPKENSKNLVICIPYKINGKFSVTITDIMADLELNHHGQCFPLYTYDGNTEMENILDSILHEYQTHYKGIKITKIGIFYYVYGLLHHPGYRSKFASNLTKDLPHIPMAPEFAKFRDIGKKLADLHIGYETCKRHDLGRPAFTPKKFSKLSFGSRTVVEDDRTRRQTDPSVIRVDGQVLFEGVPQTTYMVNGRTPLAWVVDRYRVTIDEESGIINDPCTGTDIIAVIERAVHVGLESERLIGQLPAEFEPEDWSPRKGGLDAHM